jgi:hypothetical protein
MEFRYRLKKKQTKNEEDIDQIEPLIEEKPTTDTPIPSFSSENEILNNNSLSPTMPSIPKRRDWRKDKFNISLLLFLYLLQGVPLGMAASIPLIIQTYGASWSQQATFSFAFWPFSLKLLWAPIVDALYLKRFGRRKSWLIPIQYLIGLVMITLSYYINDILIVAKTSTNSQPSKFNIIFIFSQFSFFYRYLFSYIDFFRFIVSRGYTRYLC